MIRETGSVAVISDRGPPQADELSTVLLPGRPHGRDVLVAKEVNQTIPERRTCVSDVGGVCPDGRRRINGLGRAHNEDNLME